MKDGNKIDQYLDFFTESVLSIASDRSDLNIYQYIGNCLHLINPNAYIIVNSVDELKKKTTTEAIFGKSKNLNKVFSMLNFRLIGKNFGYDSSLLELKDGKIKKFPSGLYELSFGKIPKKICQSIEKFLKIKIIYGIGFVLDKKLFANAAIIFPEKNDIENIPLIETFAKHSGLAIKKQKTDIALQKQKKRYQNIIKYMQNAFAFHKIILDEKDKPVDYQFVEVNPIFEEIIGLPKDEIIGKRVTEIIPDLKKDRTDWIKIYGEVALSGKPKNFTQRSGSLKKWFQIQAYSPEKYYFATVFRDITKQIEYKHNLQNSELRYRKLFETSKEALMIIDIEGGWKLIDCNQAFRDVFKLPKNEKLQNIYPWKISPPVQPDGKDSEKKAKELIKIAMEKGSNIFEWKHKRFDGKDFDARIILNRIDLEDRQYLQAAIFDISSQKVAEIALEKEKEYYSSFINTIGDWVWEMDKDGIHTFSNPAVKNLLGYEIEEIVGHPTTEFWFKANRNDPKEINILRKSLKAGKGWTSSKSLFRHKNGSAVYMESTAIPIFDKDNKLIGYRGIDRDITQRIKMEKALETSEEKFRNMYENTVSPILQLSTDYNIKNANDAFCKMIGYSEKELIGKKIENYLVEGTEENFIKKHEELKKGELKKLRLEKKLLIKSNKEITTLISTSLILDKDKNPAYFLENILDITERKLNAQKVQERENYLTALNKVKEILLTNDSDNVFQEITNILGSVTKASRTYIFLNSKNEKGELLMNHIAEFCHSGITTQIDNPMLQNLKYKDFAPRWEKVLSQGELIKGKIKDFPEIEQKILAPQQIKSILALPIRTEDEFSGFIGFDNCEYEKDWAQAEINFLSVAANDLAMYIKKRKDEKRFQKDFQRFQTVMNSIEAIVYVTNIYTYEILFANKFLKQLFGFDPVGEICWKIFHDNLTQPCHYCTNDKIIDENGKPKGAYVWEMYNEKFENWYRITDQAIEWIDGSIVKVEIAMDITELKRSLSKLDKHHEQLQQLVKERTKELEEKNEYLNKSRIALTSLLEDVDSSSEKLKEVNRELNYANENLESFAYSISHDLKAPLRHISGFSSILQDKIDDPKLDKNYYLEKIISSTLRMKQMIEDLLLFSRVGRREIHLMKIDLNLIIDKVFEDQLLSDKKQEINFEVSELPKVYGDPSLIRMVMDNLISNALKFTAKEEKPKIKIGFKELKNDFVEIFIADNGVGFDMKYADKLFKVFQRLHPKKDFSGSGIGLANVKRIIERLNGSIRAESKINEGATFYFSLKKYLS